MKIKYPIENPHSVSVEEILQIFQTDANQGLAVSAANLHNKQFGLNIYEAQAQKSVWRILLEQFQSPIVYLLAFGALVSLYFQNYIESASIVVVLLVNALIGFLMEMQARSSMNALKQMDVIKSKVIRDGKLTEIASEKITPGDLVVLEAGDVIPGDGRLVVSNQLQCDESSLTGESLPTLKNIETLAKDTPLGDQGCRTSL